MTNMSTFFFHLSCLKYMGNSFLIPCSSMGLSVPLRVLSRFLSRRLKFMMADGTTEGAVHEAQRAKLLGGSSRGSSWVGPGACSPGKF